MKRNDLIDLTQMGVIGVNFFMGTCSLVMADPRREEDCQSPWTFLLHRII